MIADENRERVESLRRAGFAAVSGNAADPAVLIQAHIAHAAMLVIAVPEPLYVRQMVETAKTLNPNVEIVLRTHSEDESALLLQGRARHGVLWRGGTGQGHDQPCTGALRAARRA